MAAWASPGFRFRRRAARCPRSFASCHGGSPRGPPGGKSTGNGWENMGKPWIWLWKAGKKTWDIYELDHSGILELKNSGISMEN